MNPAPRPPAGLLAGTRRAARFAALLASVAPGPLAGLLAGPAAGPLADPLTASPPASRAASRATSREDSQALSLAVPRSGLCIALLPGLLGTLGAQERPSPPAPDEDRAAVPDDLLPDRPAEVRAAAFRRVGASGDRRFLAPLLDLLRMARTPEEWYRILDALGAILGEDARAIERPWRTLTLRLAADADLPEPEGYAGWKGELLGQLVDPRYRELLTDDVPRRVRLDEVVWGGVATDGIPPLDHPATVPAAEALHVADDDPVFGVAFGGETRAYPLALVDWHEMVNDEVGGVAFSLAYCTLCGAGIAYDTSDEAGVLEFYSSGLLMRSNKLMADRRSGTLWNQLTGEPVLGPLADGDRTLPVLPVVLTRWGDWRARHPETDVLAPNTGFQRDYRPGAAYGDYFASVETMFPAPRTGATGGAPEFPKAQRFVVRTPGGSRAFAVAELGASPVLHAAVAGRRIVVVRSHAPPPHPLAAGWGAALADGGGGATPTLAAELELADLERAFVRTPELFDAPLLVALRPAVRNAFFDWERAREAGATPRLDPRLRRTVATRALAAEIRAYEAADRELSATGTPGRLVDQDGVVWSLGETALSAGTARLARLPGHLVFAFGWEAFARPGDTDPAPRDGASGDGER